MGLFTRNDVKAAERAAEKEEGNLAPKNLLPWHIGSKTKREMRSDYDANGDGVAQAKETGAYLGDAVDMLRGAADETPEDERGQTTRKRAATGIRNATQPDTVEQTHKRMGNTFKGRRSEEMTREEAEGISCVGEHYAKRVEEQEVTSAGAQQRLDRTVTEYDLGQRGDTNRDGVVDVSERLKLGRELKETAKNGTGVDKEKAQLELNTWNDRDAGIDLDRGARRAQNAQGDYRNDRKLNDAMDAQVKAQSDKGAASEDMATLLRKGRVDWNDGTSCAVVHVEDGADVSSSSRMAPRSGMRSRNDRGGSRGGGDW